MTSAEMSVYNLTKGICRGFLRQELWQQIVYYVSSTN